MGWQGGGVGVAEFGCPLVRTVGGGLMVPSVLMADAVVMPAERIEVFGGGGTTFGVRSAVIEIASCGGHTTSNKDAGRAADFHCSSLRPGWSASGGAMIDEVSGSGIGDGVSPLLIGLRFCDLSGNVGDHRPIPSEFAWMICKPDQRFEINMNINHSFLTARGCGAAKKVQKHIGP